MMRTCCVAGRCALLLAAILSAIFAVGQVRSSATSEAAQNSPAQPTALTAYLPITMNAWTLVFRDDFSDPSSGWLSYNNPVMSSGYVSGSYQILIKDAQAAVWLYNNKGWATNFRGEVDAGAYSTTNGLPGMAFDISPDGLYLFLAGNGSYWLLRYDAAGIPKFKDVIPAGSSAYVYAGAQSNRLRVIRSGTSINLYANGQWLATANDSTYGAGYVGVAAWAQTANYEARFDNFLLVRDPDNTTITALNQPTSPAAADGVGGFGSATLH